MNQTTAGMFPGQGSQKAGMGLELFEKFPDETAEADRILGVALRELCAAEEDARLHQTEFTQPALYFVSALQWRVEEWPDGEPGWLAGHSLGEYVALHAAGVFDLLTGLRLVRERGRLMAQARGGGMAAVIGLDPAQIESVLEEGGFDGVAPANYNSYEQTVISGDLDQIHAAEGAFKTAGAKLYRPLKVSAAFHSRYMAEAGREFARFLEGFEFQNPARPVLSNFTARPHDPVTLKENLANQISGPVRWLESLEYLLEHGVTEFREIGPGQVLTKLVSAVKRKASK